MRRRRDAPEARLERRLERQLDLSELHPFELQVHGTGWDLPGLRGKSSRFSMFIVRDLALLVESEADELFAQLPVAPRDPEDVVMPMLQRCP